MRVPGCALAGPVFYSRDVLVSTSVLVSVCTLARARACVVCLAAPVTWDGSNALMIVVIGW